MLVMLIPISAEVNVDLINTGSLEIDDDGSDGYSGDYVVIYNPGTSTSGASTGNMTGLIETQVGDSSVKGKLILTREATSLMLTISLPKRIKLSTLHPMP